MQVPYFFIWFRLQNHIKIKTKTKTKTKIIIIIKICT
jgi:hypothetical protein